MSAKKGFTLIELIIVITIIGVLVAIALPSYSTMMNKGAATAAQNNLTTIYKAEKSYYFANSSVYCTGACANSLATINTSLAVPPALSLNITDNTFTYSCSNVAGFTCTATGAGITLTITGPPKQIVLPGGTGCATPAGANCNPVCAPSASNHCPS